VWSTQCEICGKQTDNNGCKHCENTPSDEETIGLFWCSDCNVPIIKEEGRIDKNICPLCGKGTTYVCVDMRPVFPEERLLLEIILGKPLEYLNKSVWASKSRYFIDGKSIASINFHKRKSLQKMIEELEIYKEQNNYIFFNKNIQQFIKANKTRLDYICHEAFCFINETSRNYSHECIVTSFSGGKDSTVTADLTIRALGNPNLVHVFGNTTLEFPSTLEYVQRYRENNPLAIFKTAINKEQDFYKVCEDIGPPARMMRWCCTMFKTGPITRILNNMYPDKEILTFYGIRKSESITRSRYRRVEDDADSLKIRRQKVASPVFLWRDIEIWLYILSENLDFNNAYRLGYDRVGCWCCPNNTLKAQFLSQIYMPELSEKWRNFLIDFAKKIGKPDAEEYIDSGSWKARNGGNGVIAANDIKIRHTNCTTENNAKVYELNKPVNDSFFELFVPFGAIAPELGRKLVKETIIIDEKTKVPIISIQPFTQEGYEHSVKIKTMNIKKHDELQRMMGYQIKKYNACRRCLKCESLCKHGAISMTKDDYHIDSKKCMHCKICVTTKYLEGGCLMERYLRTKV